MKSLAIITARGGSKRIPRKNIKSFFGKPIIQYSIEVALSSNIFDEVMVSTDDLKIKQIAEKLGARVPFLRSEATSNDIASTYDVLLEVIETYRGLGIEFEYMCCIYPTAPFITTERISQGMDIVMSGKADTVLPIVPFSYPPQRGLLLNDNRIDYWFPENVSARSQDLPQIYHDCGQFYCLNIQRFLEEKKMIMKNSCPIIIDELEVQDIDNEEDWALAEIKYKKLKGLYNQ